MPRRYKRYCNNCGKYYENSNRYFCSWECYNLAGRSEEQKRKVRESCKKSLNSGWFKKGHIPANKNSVKMMCLFCKKEFEVSPAFAKGRKYCSRECYDEDMRLGKRRGKNSNSWKGGIFPIEERIRKSLAYINWRTAIFERDNYTCQECGIRSNKGKKVYLHVHHRLVTFSRILNCLKQWVGVDNLYDAALKFSPLWDIENGQTLCVDCHKEFHKKYGKIY